jgi:glycosyltransferase involved in cell wall biosynthesis
VIQNALDGVTFLIPCLNEVETLEGCISEIKECFDKKGYPYEILVADNGSTDKSQDLAFATLKKARSL